ncbi:hypothetical protein E4U53_007940 [Claviceps sorghi]|nr:hypothetical protein E4U53_007940 [Claviceps sorghi]
MLQFYFIGRVVVFPVYCRLLGDVNCRATMSVDSEQMARALKYPWRRHALEAAQRTRTPKHLAGLTAEEKAEQFATEDDSPSQLITEAGDPRARPFMGPASRCPMDSAKTPPSPIGIISGNTLQGLRGSRHPDAPVWTVIPANALLASLAMAGTAEHALPIS